MSPGGDLRPYVSALHAETLGGDPGPHWRQVEGSLLFADVSGFTPLTERLTRQGKVGAEQLTETLNLVFSALLHVAEGFGGDCLKFGGDALLLLFRGDEHQRRAAAAAAGMQQALREVRRGSGAGGGGLSGLGISMGAHSGPVQVFTVGTSHRELVVAGPTLTRTLELESTATRGQVLLDAAVAAALDPVDVRAVEPGAALLRRAPAVPPAGAPPRPPGSAEVRAGLPEALHDHLDGRRKEGEHRLASVGFVKFGGVDEVLHRDGADVLAGALHDLVTVVQRSCDEVGVTFVATDVDVNGGKVIVAAGAPTVADDDEDRLLLALGQVVEATGDLPLRVRAGANRGRIFAVDLGSEERRTFTVMGDAVNLAARVMGHAGWGEVLATQDVLDRARTEFALASLPPFRVKGKSAPVRAARVGAPVGRRAGWDGTGRLVGREVETALLRDACAAARRGEGRIVELVGEAGIGKSRLVSAVLDHDHQLTTLAVEAGRYSLATPYHALRRGLRSALGATMETPDDAVADALRDVVDREAPDLRPWMPLLGVPLGLDLPDSAETATLDPSRRQSVLHRACVELMGRVLSGPTLLVVEDAHWLDAASASLLLALIEGIERRPWAAVITRRPTPGGLELPDELGARRQHLEALDVPQLLELAATPAGAAELPPGVLEQLVDRSGGNPLFLRELVNATLTGSLTEVPETVEAVIASQIDTLPGPDRALLRHAAVLGATVHPGTLAAMVEEDLTDLERSMRRLHHFLEDAGDGSLRFSHILLRDVAYEGLPYRTRRRLHERAGEILERSVDDADTLAELLSIHFERAGRWPETWRYSRVAADRARRLGAPVEAAGFLERCLVAADHLDAVGAEERAEVAESLGDNWEFSGRYDRASAAYRRALGLAAGDAPRRAQLCRKLGFVRDHEGRYQTAQRWFRRGLATLDEIRDPASARALRAEIVTAIVSSRYRQGRHARALPLIREAIADAEASGARAALAHAYFVYDELLIDRGRYQEATHSDLAAAIYEELGDHRGAAAAYNEMGVTAYWLGRWDHAVRCYEQAIEADRRAGALVYHAIYLNNIGEIRSDQGRLVEAEQLLGEACELWTAGGWRAGTGWALSNLGRLAARDGRHDEAGRRLDEARSVLADIGAAGMLLETDARDMERFVLVGDHQQALEAAGELLDRAKRLAFPGVTALVQRLEGYAWIQAGEPRRAGALIEESVRSSLARGARFEAALGSEALARLGELVGSPVDEVVGHRLAATEVFEELGVVSTPVVPLASAIAVPPLVTD